MKILHLVHNFPPEFRGGTEIYLQALCKLQQDAGKDVSVLAGSEKRDWRDDFLEEVHEGIRVLRFLRLPQGEGFTADFYLERFEGLLCDLLERERFDLVHVHHWMNRRAGKKTQYSACQSQPECNDLQYRRDPSPAR